MIHLVHPVGLEEHIQGLCCFFADCILIFLVFFGDGLIELFESCFFQFFLEGILEVNRFGSLGVKQMIDLFLPFCFFSGDWYFLIVLLEELMILRFYFQPILLFGLAQGPLGDALWRLEVILPVI